MTVVEDRKAHLNARKARGRRAQKRRIAVLHAAHVVVKRQRVSRLAKITRRKAERAS